jgi:hypothetical protein
MMVTQLSGFEQVCAMPVPLKRSRKRAVARIIGVWDRDRISLMAGTPFLGVFCLV